jgi:hypothetical protein
MFRYRSRRSTSSVLSFSLVLMAAAAGAAPPAPIGGPAIVSTNPSVNLAGPPRIAVSGNENYRLVWHQPGTQFDVHTRRVLSTGTLTSETLVNTTLEENQATPAVSVNSSGDWGAVWISTDQEGAGTGNRVVARRSSVNGALLSAELDVDHPVTTTDPSWVAIDLAENDEMVVTWKDFDSGEAWMRRFDTAGIGGDEFVIRDNGEPSFTRLAVAALDGSRAVAVWQESGTPPSLHGRCADADSPLGPQFPISVTSGSGGAYAPDVASAADGSFVVAWSRSDAGGVWTIVARRFGADCQPRGGEILVGSRPNGVSNQPTRVDVAADGAFVVTWNTSIALGGILAREYTKSGVVVGPASPVPGVDFGTQSDPDVAIGPTTFGVSWKSPDFDDGGLDHLLMRRFVRSVVFTDDFEGGSSGAWSSVTP